MNEHISLSEAARIMGDNIIGPAELSAIDKLRLAVPDDIPDIPFSARELEEKKDDYLLVLGIGNFKDGSKVTIRALKERFGMDPDISEPCFYNQDWYDKEAFIDIPMQDGWYLIRRADEKIPIPVGCKMHLLIFRCMAFQRRKAVVSRFCLVLRHRS